MAQHIFSSSPIASYSIGKFVFDKGILLFDGDDADQQADELRNLLKTMPPIERNKIVEIDIAAAEQVVRESQLLSGANTTKDFDSASSGARTLDLLKQKSGTIGIGSLEEQQRINDGKESTTTSGEIRPDNAGPDPVEVGKEMTQTGAAAPSPLQALLNRNQS